MPNFRPLLIIALAMLLLPACSPTVIVVTATPTATPPPSATPPPTKTLRPTGTASPSPAPSPTATPALPLPPTATIGKYHSQTACDHAYLPLRAGASWTFLITSDKDQNYQAMEIRTVASVKGDETGATAVVHIEQTKDQRVLYSVDVTYQCSADGYVLGDNNSLVPWSHFEPGAIWEETRTWKQPAANSCWGTGDYTQTFSFGVEAARGIKSVAGEYDGILMTQVGSLSVGPRTSSADCAENTGSRTWLVPGIGRVRSEHTLTNLDGTYHSTTVYDLQSYIIP